MAYSTLANLLPGLELLMEDLESLGLRPAEYPNLLHTQDSHGESLDLKICETKTKS